MKAMKFRTNYASRFTRNALLLAAILLPAVSAWSGEVTTDDLIVSNNATIYGKLDFPTVVYSTNGSGASATGGTIATNGNYIIHTFTNVGTSTFEIAGGSLNCDVLIVAGGGGAGRGSWGSGGGGGGGVIYTNITLSAGTNSIVVGARGERNTATAGGNSIFKNYTAIGGGRGGYTVNDPTDGGSGGGAVANRGYYGLGTAGQGHNGGTSYNNDPSGYHNGGGGGGASAAGGNGGIANGNGGNGGEGYSCDISGTTQVYGSGGGGAGCDTAGTGTGAGYGGTGAGNGMVSKLDQTVMRAASDATYYGCGGGGAHQTAQGDAGYGFQGVVIVRYSIYQTSSSNITTLTISSNGISQVSTSAVNSFMGNVGIGTTDPAEKLHVAGNVQVDGALNFGGETRSNWPSGAEGALMVSNNLSDVENAATARDNLGLGSAATYDAGAFITTNGDGSCLTNITASQVGAISTNDGALLAVNNLSDVNNSGTARGNLGLGSAATNETADFLSPAGNGSQLTGITASQVGAVATNGDGSQLTGITAAQAGALSTNGGTMNGELTILNPGGDIPMGVYTNQ